MASTVPPAPIRVVLLGQAEPRGVDAVRRRSNPFDENRPAPRTFATLSPIHVSVCSSVRLSYTAPFATHRGHVPKSASRLGQTPMATVTY